jgi:hypothetical protein
MKKIILLICLSLILLLIYISDAQAPVISGNVKSVKYGNGLTTIEIEGSSCKILAFSIVPLEVNKKIKIYGKKENSEIIVARITETQP